MLEHTHTFECNLRWIAYQLSENGVEITPQQVERSILNDAGNDPEVAASMVVELANNPNALSAFAKSFADRERVVFVTEYRGVSTLDALLIFTLGCLLGATFALLI